MPGDVIGGVRSEKNGSAFEIVVIAESPQRDFLQTFFLVSFYHDLAHVRGNPARSDPVYLNVVDSPFAGQILREGNDAAFTRVIANGLKLWRGPVDARDGGYVDDFPGGLREQKSSRQIRLHHFVPMFEPHLFDRGPPRSPSVVDENIDTPELRHGGANDRLDFCGIPDVANERQCFDSEALQFPGSLLATLFLASAEHEIGAHFRQTFGHLPAQADGTAGDDSHASSEIK